MLPREQSIAQSMAQAAVLDVPKGFFSHALPMAEGPGNTSDSAIVLELKLFSLSSPRPGLWLLLCRCTGTWELCAGICLLLGLQVQVLREKGLWEQ